MTLASSITKAGGPSNTGQRWLQKRHLKYAVLHLCASIELLFKVRLHREHWSLVFNNVSKADKEAQDEGEFESVTFHELIERLVRICKVSLSDEEKRRLKNLRKRRNQLEHFGAVGSLLAVTASVSEMVSFTLDFVESTFQAESREEQGFLITDIRSRLGARSAFVEQRWKEIQKDVDDFHSDIECPTCLQRALLLDYGTVKCRFCYYASDPHEGASEYISRVLGHDNRSAMTCPDCQQETLVLKASGHGYFCFNCGGEWGSGELVRCCECNELYVGDEKEDGNICHDCFQAKVEKD